MQNNEVDLNENITIYTHTKINLDFFNPAMENLRPLNIVQKPLSTLPFSQADKVAIIIVNDLAELASSVIHCEHSIVITAQNNLTATPEHLSHAMIYQQSASEDHQQALEKVFHALVKFYFSTELFLDPFDFYQSDAFAKGQRCINIYLLQEQQLINDHLTTLFEPIGQDDAVILNFEFHQSSFSLDKVHGLTQMMIEQLGEKFDGEIFYSCSTSSKVDQQTLIYLCYLSA